MNDAQTWTAVGGMLVSILAFMTLMMRLFGSTIDARFDSVGARFDAVDARFDGLTALMVQRFEQVDRRIDNLDRDVEAITRRFWDGPTT